MKKNLGLLMILANTVGCWNASDEPTLPERNDALGIASFVEEEVADRTIVRGLDASGTEIARLDLVHGWFMLSPPFTDDYDAPGVDGRKLSVHALGKQLHWETAGFDPVLQMPAPPPTQWAVAVFLADPHVKRVLDQWQIGFELSVGENGEVAYTAGQHPGNFRGDSPQTCDGLTTCGTAFYGTINNCGSGVAAIQAARLTQRPGSNCGLYTGPSADQVRVAQCCPSNSGPLGLAWFAEKACPSTADHNTACGLHSGGACKGCPEYPVDSAQQCWVAMGSSVGTCNSISVNDLFWAYWTSFYDDFNRTSGMGSQWNVSSGSYNTDGNYAVSTNSGANYARALPNPALVGANHSVEAIIVVPSGATDVGVFGRSNSTSSDLYAASLSTAQTITLKRRNASTWTTLDWSNAWVSPGYEHKLKLIVTGSNPTRIEVWLDGGLTISYTDSSGSQVTSGNPGIYGTGSNVKYNWLEIATVGALPQVPGLPFEDFFDRVGYTLGQGWIVDQAIFSTQYGDYALQHHTILGTAVAVVNPGTDYAIQADVSVAQPNRWAGVFGRASNSNDSSKTNYSAYISTTNVELGRYNNGSYTSLGTYSTSNTAGTYYNLKLVITGSNPVQLTVYRNSSQVISYSDSSANRITAGDVGIGNKTASWDSKWNMFRVDAQ